MSDTAEATAGQDPESAGQDPHEAAERLRERRGAALRAARRQLWRPSHLDTVRTRLAWLNDGAEGVYDLDRPVDLYGGQIVETLEERVAGLLGKEAAAFFPTGTMAQQVALRGPHREFDRRASCARPPRSP
jgi:hypothetical protein